MYFSTALLALPLLASAVPSFKRDREQLTFLPHVDPATDHGLQLDLSELRLVQFAEDEPPVWISELEKIQAKADGKRFMDIDEVYDVADWIAYPTPGNYSEEIKRIHKSLDIKHMKKFLSKFTSFRTRYYRSETGKQSQKFLLSTITEIASSHPNITIKEFPHPWGQNSIIVRFAPATPEADSAPVTIIGAHQDSTNQWPFLPAPGADDDGSGTTSSLEGFSALIKANFTPSTPVEFHYYSAEEGGLLGSQAIAKAYEDAGRKVLAMLQMDMTAWVKVGTKESVGIIQDYVDPGLTEFVEELVDLYLDIPAVKTKCGYACSDHASFGKAGYPSAFAIESTFENSNHNIHTSQDTTDHPEFSFKHMKEFSKLVVAFAVELGGLE
ncbi:bacterial leucyl aminopeptidase [Tremella mesenterica]|uniref:Peptide hydrolase n=1 Tax=Tremella mesenterica TaxID=5217 RepID=A0A4Q1BRB4_TREME|nr:bacterial leucyl aminopeptidase [Tremella mesenterica]